MNIDQQIYMHDLIEIFNFNPDKKQGIPFLGLNLEWQSTFNKDKQA